MAQEVHEAIVEYQTEPTTEEQTQQFYPEIARLTSNQRAVLVALTTNLVSENRKGDGEIAKELGLNRGTIYDCRKNPVFARLLSQITVDVVHGMADKVVGNLVRLAENSVTANKILATIADIYANTSKVAVLSAHVDINAQTKSVESTIDDFCMEMIRLGVPVDRIVARYNQIRAEGYI